MSHAPHPHPELLHRFAENPCAVDPVDASSVEAHLVDCASCRTSLNDVVGRQFFESSWAAVAEGVDEPRRGALERGLAGAGFSDTSARLLAATPALRIAATTALASVIAAAVVSSHTGAARLFLVVAPLVPLGVVAAAFAATTEPAGEVAIGTPLHGIALVVRRSIVVALAAFAALGAAAVVLGDVGVSTAAWVLPSLALSVSVLALATWVRVEVATAALAGGWTAIVWPVRLLVDGNVDVGRSFAFATGGQVVAVVVALASLAVVVARRDRFESVEVFS